MTASTRVKMIATRCFFPILTFFSGNPITKLAGGASLTDYTLLWVGVRFRACIYERGRERWIETNILMSIS
jgi:hypothetical protein